MGIGQGRRKLAIHGPLVEIQSTVPLLDDPLDTLFATFDVPGWPDHFHPVSGTIHPYSETEVLSNLPQSARHVTRIADAMDIYEDADVFFLVDDRWGMSRIDPARGQWQSWIIPMPKVDPFCVAELAVLWPLAQLMRPRGMHLLPAISAVRDGFAVLMICPFGVVPELTAMMSNGYKLIGQRWTALCEDDGRIALHHLPGRVEHSTTPRLRLNSQDEPARWLDVTQAHAGCWQNHAFCDAVVVVEPGRRAQAHMHILDRVSAIETLRREWPIVDVDAAGKASPLPSLLAQNCKVFEMQLSRNSNELLALFGAMRAATPPSEDRSVAA